YDESKPTSPNLLLNPPILIDGDPLSSQNSRGSHIKIPNEILTILVAGNPFRFSLAEFQTITGLPGGPFPEHYQSPSFNTRNAAKDPLWQKLLGHDSLITVVDIAHMLETEDNMETDKRLRLAPNTIVDGVLIAHKQVPRPTLQYIQMVDNVEEFLKFPWGCESFLKTITSLQLVAFQAMPLLAIKIPAAPNPATLLELEDPHLPLHKSLSINDFEVAEADSNLRFTTLIPLADNAPLGDSSKPEFNVQPTVTTIHRKHTVPRKQSLRARDGIKKMAMSPRKQRRISNYFQKNLGATPPTNEWLGEKVELLDILVAEVKADTRRLKRKLSHRHNKTGSKFSSFKFTLRTPKKRTTAQEKGTQIQPHQHDHIPESPIETEPNSPLISQYNAHRFSNAPAYNPTITDSPTDIINYVVLTVNGTHIVNPPQTSIGAPPEHNSPTHDSLNQSNHDPTALVGLSPFHVSLNHTSTPNNSATHNLHDPMEAK
uniref:DUF1985 domain-containing protein n=2 Tax=Brassica TaxID=3705 RepID=A0A0D2ZVH5_BRAOL